MNSTLVSLSLISCIAATASAAAPYGVTATIRDALTAETLPGASCAVFLLPDTVKPIINGMAGADGSVGIDLPGSGNYLMKVTMVSQKPVSRSFTLSENQPVVDLGSIAMQPEGEALEEVQVVRRRPVIEATGEKVSYNLTEDPTSATHTVLEMLRKVPMVTVDAQDNISINGQSNFKIYVNGKEDPMLTQNASTVLKSLPASSIKRIEVILEPGAKYDAEGVGGILNIITETATNNNGQMATITAGGGNDNARASLYGIVKQDKVTASVNLSYYNRFVNRNNVGSINRETFDVENPTFFDQQISQKSRNNFLNGNASLSWEPNAKNLFTLSASGYGGRGTNLISSNLNTFDHSGQNLLFSNQHMKAKWLWSSITFNAGYQHNFDQQGHNIVLSYQYVNGKDRGKNYTTILSASQPDFIPCVYDYQNSPTNEHTVQLDYTSPFSQYFTLETGVKGIFRRNSSDGYTMNGNSWESLTEADYNNVALKQNQDVGAVYATYAGTFGSFGVKAGIRYEHTNMDVHFKTPGYENFSTVLNDLVPNASLSYSITPTQNLFASYQQRIRRPGVDELNPHATEFIAGFITKGNPNLTSEKNHTIALSYSNFAGKLGLNFRAFHTFSNNCISRYSYEEAGALIQTYNNVGQTRNWGINGFVKYQINALMDFSINASVKYSHLNYKAQEMENQGWNLSLNANYNYSLPWKMKLNAYGGFSTRNYTLQGYSTGWNYHGLSLSKSFLKNDMLKLTLSGTNFAAPHINFRTVSNGSNFHNTMKMRVPVWNVGMTVAVTLGGLNSSVRSTAKSIQNDDVEQSQGGSGNLGK